LLAQYSPLMFLYLEFSTDGNENPDGNGGNELETTTQTLLQDIPLVDGKAGVRVSSASLSLILFSISVSLFLSLCLN